MGSLLMTLHVMTCIALIVVVLLQRGKGSDIGAALGGGGSQTVFGARGAGNFLTKLTTGAAVVFMGTSLSLAYLGSQEASIEIFDEPIIEETVDDLEEVPAAATDALEEIGGGLEEVGDALEEVGEAATGALEDAGEAAGAALEAVTPEEAAAEQP